MGIVLQSTGMYRHIAVREAIAHWARFYPAPRDVDEVLELAGLGEKADAYARTLSGGQLRRLDFALALVGDPELIFLDEPTTGFDPAARRAAWEVVRSLQELGKTILLTTHYLDEAQALCDRVAIVKEGRFVAEGPPAALGAGSARYRVTWRDEHGEIVTRETEDPTALLHQLTSAALARGEPLRDLSVTRPTLEDVYLELPAEAASEAEEATAGG
jgi:ABC-2 type transport system ATP-binding protein